MGVSALAIDPQRPQTLYAGSSDYVYKSSDGGGSWTVTNNGMTDSYVYALAIDPKTPSTLYAGTPYVGYSGAHDGWVFRSTDKGETWTSVNKGLMNVPVQADKASKTAPAKCSILLFIASSDKSQPL